MIAVGVNTALGFIEETSFGVTPAAPTLKAAPFTSEALSVTKEALFTENDSRGRHKRTSMASDDVGGEIVMEFSPIACDLFLKHLLGQNIDAGISNPYTHTMRTYFNNPYSMTIEKALYDLGKYMLYTGMVTDALTFDIAQEGIVMMHATMFGKKCAINASSVTANPLTSHTDNPFTGYEAQIEIDGALSDLVNSASMTFRNNYQPTGRNLDMNIAGYALGNREFNGAFDIFLPDTATVSKFQAGTRISMKMTFYRNANVYYEFYFPRVVLKECWPNVAGADELKLNATWEAETPTSGNQAPMVLTIKNSSPTV